MAKKKSGTDVLYSLIGKARGFSDTIILGRGDPDFDTPVHIRDAAKKAIKENYNDYTPVEGLLELREAIAARTKKINNIDLDPETEIVFTNGGQEALFLMMVTALKEGDEIIVPEPNYNTYADSIDFVGGVRVAVPCYAKENFRVRPELVRAAITKKTRAILLVSPNNPTATVISPEDMKELTQIAIDNDLIIIGDDIYDIFVYDDFKHTSPASLPGVKERSLTLNALSKAYSMTGWRAGWVFGSSDLISQVKMLKAATTGPASIVAQYAALSALNGSMDEVYKMRETYIDRRKVVLNALDEMGLEYGIPQGGQFVYADITSTGLSSVELAERILDEQHVLVYPGSSFSKDLGNFIRMTFLQPKDVLSEGLERMKATMKKITS